MMVSGKSVFFALVSALVLSACGQPQAARPHMAALQTSENDLLVTPQALEPLGSGSASTNATAPAPDAYLPVITDPAQEARNYIRTMFLVWPGREPSAGEMASYLALWQQGVPLTAFSWYISAMPEAKIRHFYLTILNRDFDQAGMDFWVAQLNAGVPLSEIEAAFRAAVGR
jgi:hypothetical protein